MITATFLAVFFIPLFYVMIVQLFPKKSSGIPAMGSKPITGVEGQ
jgi:hypothetical protein